MLVLVGISHPFLLTLHQCILLLNMVLFKKIICLAFVFLHIMQQSVQENNFLFVYF